MPELDYSKEEWKDAVGFEGMYEVSNYGRVRSTTRTIIRRNGRPCSRKGQIRKLHVTDDGYLQISISNLKERNHYWFIKWF